MSKSLSPQEIWQHLRREALEFATSEPALASFYHASILNHDTLRAAVSYHLATLLSSQAVPAMSLREIFIQALQHDSEFELALCRDIEAYCDRDPACNHFLMPLLYFKGFHALQAYRLAHWLWQQDRRALALYLQNQISQTFHVDIHPGAKIGSGIMIDHATGVVIGETAVVGDNVSMLHSVSLGGSGNMKGDRHPKVGDGVLISAGAKILGNIKIGDYARIGAGSVVLTDVPAHQTAVGVPARIIEQSLPAGSGQDMMA
ncbi:serine O-acetyltransferase [Gilvimarinus polysaccharolyticus]|uniref:serine O-acetyltransferase n=1 Tax=Gilvimarinus polysaccharolyticus TaxID=863921 RepID=UPI000AFFB5E5